MKVGIVTYFDVPNYGAMLQAYAMQKYLKMRGHHVVFVNHTWFPEKILLKYFFRPQSFNSFRGKFTYNKSMVATFLPFQEHFEKTRRYESIASIRDDPPDCDCFIVGSDQMWNVDICKRGKLPYVFLDIFGDKAMRIAYAVSFGRPIPAELHGEVENYMRKFTAISVREKNAVEWVCNLSGKEAEWLCDPTLLYNVEDYDELFPKSYADEKTPYIFEYMQGKRDITHDVGKYFGITKIMTEMRASDKWFDMLLGLQIKIGIGNWLRRIKHASFIVTSSYHGILFSIIYKKPFMLVPLTGHVTPWNDRFFSILGFLGLDNRIYDESKSNSLAELLDAPINWTDVHQRLANWRNKTDAYFKNLSL